MTTNSFGSPLPRFDYPSVQPAVTRASRIKALPLPARILSFVAAAGLSEYQYFSPEPIRRLVDAY